MDIIPQFFDIINSKKKILIILAESPSGDVFFSALALQKLLQDCNKELKIEVVCSNLGEFVNSQLAKNIENNKQLPKKWIFTLDTSKKKIRSLKYEKNENNLKIIINPENPKENPGDFLFKTAHDFEAIISMGIKKKEDIIKIFNNDFPKIHIINIDNTPNNEEFGEINITKEAISIAQMIFQIFNDQIYQKKLDPETLSLLFSAFISATQQFQNLSTTNSKLLKAASVLLEKGADLQMAFSNIELQTSNQVKS